MVWKASSLGLQYEHGLSVQIVVTVPQCVRKRSSQISMLYHHLRNVFMRNGCDPCTIRDATSSVQPTQPRENTISYSPGCNDVWPSWSTNPRSVAFTVKCSVFDSPGVKCTRSKLNSCLRITGVLRALSDGIVADLGFKNSITTSSPA